MLPDLKLTLNSAKVRISSHNVMEVQERLWIEGWQYEINQFREVVVQGLPFANFEIGRVQSLVLSYKIS